MKLMILAWVLMAAQFTAWITGHSRIGIALGLPVMILGLIIHFRNSRKNVRP